MILGTLQIEMTIPGSASLKEKRFVLQSIKTKLRNKFNVSVAETQYQDKWQRAVIAIATVSNSKTHIEETLQTVLSFVEKDDRLEIVDSLTEIF
jgi:uncharacterized protein YlxP (DUF503 family)